MIELFLYVVLQFILYTKNGIAVIISEREGFE